MAKQCINKIYKAQCKKDSKGKDKIRLWQKYLKTSIILPYTSS